jgi:hypothetical protein
LDDLVLSVSLSAARNGVSFTLNDMFKDVQQNGYRLDEWD